MEKNLAELLFEYEERITHRSGEIQTIAEELSKFDIPSELAKHLFDLAGIIRNDYKEVVTEILK